MRAGMDTAAEAAPRRARARPDRPAHRPRPATSPGWCPADGDLGEGDQVALLEPRSLLLGIARASRYTGVDNPRLWTTADVRAALEALGLPGPRPVGRGAQRRGLPVLALRAAPSRAADPRGDGGLPAGRRDAAAPPQPPLRRPLRRRVRAAAPAREQPSSAAIAQAVAASAAAAHAAAARPQRTAPRRRTRDTVAIDGPAAPPEDGGIGGLFAQRRARSRRRPTGAPRPPPSMKVVPPRTSVFPATPAAAAPPPAAAPRRPSRSPTGPSSRWPVTATPRSRAAARAGAALLMALVGVLVVAVLAVGGWLVLRDGTGGGGSRTAAGSTLRRAGDGGPEGGRRADTSPGWPSRWRRSTSTSTCVGHAYGDTARLLRDNDCTGLSRALYSAEIGGEAGRRLGDPRAACPTRPRRASSRR